MTELPPPSPRPKLDSFGGMLSFDPEADTLDRPDGLPNASPVASSPGPSGSRASNGGTTLVVRYRTPRAVKASIAVLGVGLVGVSVALGLSSSAGNAWRIEAERTATELAVAETALSTTAAALAGTQESAEQFETQLEQQTLELTRISDERDAAQEQLVRSEADVQALQQRVNELANEKAQAQDEAANAIVSVSVLYELAQTAANVTEWTTACIAYQDVWVDVITGIAQGYSYDEYELNRFITEMATTCGTAEAAAQRLQEIVGSL